jgi:hypothetical protein
MTYRYSPAPSAPSFAGIEDDDPQSFLEELDDYVEAVHEEQRLKCLQGATKT